MEAHPPAECARVLQDEAKEIEGYLAGLRPEEWMKQSACDGWQVRDVAAHLAGGAEIHLGMIIRGLEGDASPGPGGPPAGTAMLPPLLQLSVPSACVSSWGRAFWTPSPPTTVDSAGCCKASVPGTGRNLPGTNQGAPFPSTPIWSCEFKSWQFTDGTSAQRSSPRPI